jgi:hypothetical protein
MCALSRASVYHVGQLSICPLRPSSLFSQVPRNPIPLVLPLLTLFSLALFTRGPSALICSLAVSCFVM